MDQPGYRSQYPADFFTLPAPDHTKQDRHAWRARMIGRLHIEGAETAVSPSNDPKEHSEEHWLWLGARQPDGRAVIRMHRKVRSLPRVLWSLYRGGAPDTRLVVRRTCDEARCVNPFHAELVKRGSWQTKPTPPSRNEPNIEALAAQLGISEWRVAALVKSLPKDGRDPRTNPRWNSHDELQVALDELRG